jgi:hypothetical protein
VRDRIVRSRSRLPGPRRRRAPRRVALEQRVLGLGVERGGGLVEHQQDGSLAHEAAGERELLPLAEADLDAVGQLGPSWVSRPRRSARPRRRLPRGRPRRRSRARRRAAAGRRAPRCGARQLEAEEVLEGAGQARAPGLHRHRARGRRRRPGCGRARRLVEAAEQLHQGRLAGAVLADDRDHAPGFELEVDVLEHQAVGAGVGERHALQADALGEPLRRRGVGVLLERRGVVLEPRQSREPSSQMPRRKPISPTVAPM